MTTLAPSDGPKTTGRTESDDWDGEEGAYDDDEVGEENIDDEAEAEAEEIARRLGDQLWADISKARAATNSTPVNVSTSHPTLAHPALISTLPLKPPSKKELEAIVTMKAILAFSEKDSLVRSTLASAIVSESDGDNVLNVLTRTVAAGAVPNHLAKPLSHLLVTLARSDVLFANLRHSNASSIQLDKGKRKREQGPDDICAANLRPVKRPYFPTYDLQGEIIDAVHIITQALSGAPKSSLDPSVISSIQLQLHQVFLFAVTCSARGGPEMSALQELSGLIQVISVLSGIHIGPPSPPNTLPHVVPSKTHPSQINIGTAVYPCLVPSCHKIFSRLYSLRSHQRVHAIHRPFRCTFCPASFARNHDLKRHVKLHDKKAWKCAGCDKMFSRRDAIKRHKNNSSSRGLKGEACSKAEIFEVELTNEEAEEMVKEGRRAKMWNGAGNPRSAPGAGGYADEVALEEGEILPSVIGRIQSSVLGLHPILQELVSTAVSTTHGPAAPPPDTDPTVGQATLASVIARAQLQNMPKQDQCPPEPGPSASAAQQPDSQIDGARETEDSSSLLASLLLYGLSEEQTKMLEQAIASAASAAQAQAEAEAALEEEEDNYDDEDDYGVRHEVDAAGDDGNGGS